MLHSIMDMGTNLRMKSLLPMGRVRYQRPRRSASSSCLPRNEEGVAYRKSLNYLWCKLKLDGRAKSLAPFNSKFFHLYNYWTCTLANDKIRLQLHSVIEEY